jgi:2-oxo-4-hydroxy-4-carboxy-5-ureidoimidazoline decarboxylase
MLRRCPVGGAHGVSRPFESLAEVLETSDTIWEECDVDDYEEAFTHHPKIGDVESLAKKYANTKTWATGEQKGVESADRAVIEKLAEGNTAYEEKFGHIFIVNATGKSAAEMLAMLEARMKNDPKDEILVAAGEQNKITTDAVEETACVRLPTEARTETQCKPLMDADERRFLLCVLCLLW